jgi:hypothetical protein
VDQPWDKVTAPGTLEDMIEDARAAGFDLQKRTIHDWIRRGLLASLFRFASADLV